MQRGLGLVCESAAPFEIGAPWGWGCDRSGVGWEVLGIMKWCCQVRWVAVELLGWGAAEASPLDIGEGAPLELEGGWVGVLWKYGCWRSCRYSSVCPVDS